MGDMMGGRRSVFISGAGPTGMVAAMLFDALGWEVVLCERRASPQDFEKNKSFNYLIDPRGQEMLRRLGIYDRLYDCGVETRGFTGTTLTPDGRSVTKSPPIIDPARPTCFWTTRRAFLTMLHDALRERGGRIELLYEHEVTRLEAEGAADRAAGSGGRARVLVTGPDGSERRFAPDLVLACDGLNSAIRRAAAALDAVPPGHFAMQQSSSISTGLRYKVLNLPARFEAAGGTIKVDDNRMSYIIPSRHKDRIKACSLFAFPVADPDHPRSVNIIREADHHLWTITDADELLDFLDDAFPQLDMRALVSREEAADFVSFEPGSFPASQYARHLVARLGEGDDAAHVVLLGDAAHAFPPDLGLGVNSALQDLTVLMRHMDEGGMGKGAPLADTLADALEAYAAEREPESRDLAWVVRNFFPEQYNHRPWALRRWAAGFVVRKQLNALAPRVFDKPAFYLSQDPAMTYGEMKRRKLRTDRRVRALAAGLVGLAGWASWVAATRRRSG